MKILIYEYIILDFDWKREREHKNAFIFNFERTAVFISLQAKQSAVLFHSIY